MDLIQQCTIRSTTIELPIQPLWDLKAASILLGVSVATLRSMLSTHKAHIRPPIYKVRGLRLNRLLRGSDIKALQARRLRGPGVADYLAGCPG